jgi:hypothetical protein
VLGPKGDRELAGYQRGVDRAHGAFSDHLRRHQSLDSRDDRIIRRVLSEGLEASFEDRKGQSPDFLFGITLGDLLQVPVEHPGALPRLVLGHAVTAIWTRGRSGVTDLSGLIHHNDYAEVCVKPRNRWMACTARGYPSGSSA